MKLYIIALLALTVPAVAQAPKPPEISDKQKVAFFKAQASLQRAQEQMSSAQQAVQASVKAMEDTCGGPGSVTLDSASQEPVCIVKPKPAAPGEKK